jgi:hypothetical protein
MHYIYYPVVDQTEILMCNDVTPIQMIKGTHNFLVWKGISLYMYSTSTQTITLCSRNLINNIQLPTRDLIAREYGPFTYHVLIDQTGDLKIITPTATALTPTTQIDNIQSLFSFGKVPMDDL